MQIDIRLAFTITISLLILLLISDTGYITIDRYNKNIIIKNISGKTVLSSIDSYEFWWNYDFDPGIIITDETAVERRWKSRSNKVIVNLVLKNEIQRIRFKETIMLDTRHPNDAIYLEAYNSESTRTICIQRIDKLMHFLESYVKDSQFVINEKYRK